MVKRRVKPKATPRGRSRPLEERIIAEEAKVRRLSMRKKLIELRAEGKKLVDELSKQASKGS